MEEASGVVAVATLATSGTFTCLEGVRLRGEGALCMSSLIHVAERTHWVGAEWC